MKKKPDGQKPGARQDSQGEKPLTLERAKEYALRCITYRPRTVWEIKKKLSDRGYGDDITALVIGFLKEYSFVDDDTFVEMWLRSRTTERPTGRRRIYAELSQKGVDRAVIESHLGRLSPGKEEDMATALVERKCRRSEFDYRKMMGFLLRRGFSPDTIKKVLAMFEQPSQ